MVDIIWLPPFVIILLRLYGWERKHFKMDIDP
jgi:hypothetical protein